MTLGRHTKIPNQCIIRMFQDEDGFEVENVGDVYVEFATYNMRTKIAFGWLKPIKFRVIATAEGNEEHHKGIDILDITRALQLCEVIWSGTGVNRCLTGAWTDNPLMNQYLSNLIGLGDDTIAVRIKGCSDTEEMVIYAVDLQIMYYG